MLAAEQHYSGLIKLQIVLQRTRIWGFYITIMAFITDFSFSLHSPLPWRAKVMWRHSKLSCQFCRVYIGKEPHNKALPHLSVKELSKMLVLIFWWLLVFLHLDNAMKWKQASPLPGFHAEVQGSHVFVHKSKQTNKKTFTLVLDI